MAEKQVIRRGSRWRRRTRKLPSERRPGKGTVVVVYDGRSPVMYIREDDPAWVPEDYRQARADFLRDFEPVEEAPDG